MHVPLCNYEVHHQEYEAFDGARHCDEIALIKPCLAGCASHRENEFDRDLRRQHPDLHLGFDMKRGRWVVYRWTTEVEDLKQPEGETKLRFHRRFLDIVIDCKWAIEIRTKEGGRRMEFHPRNFGEWVMKELSRFDPRRFTPDQSWVGEMLDAQADKSAEEDQKKIRKEAEDMVADAMTLADRGAPWYRKKQFRQEKTAREAIAEANT